MLLLIPWKHLHEFIAFYNHVNNELCIYTFTVSGGKPFFLSPFIFSFTIFFKNLSVIFFSFGQATPEQSWTHEAYLLFPVHLDGTLLDNANAMKTKKEFFSTSDVLQIFRQVYKNNVHLAIDFLSMEYAL